MVQFITTQGTTNFYDYYDIILLIVRNTFVNIINTISPLGSMPAFQGMYILAGIAIKKSLWVLLGERTTLCAVQLLGF